MPVYLLSIVVATANVLLIGVNGHSEGVGSCAAGFDKFPVGTEHNWQETTRPGGLLDDNYGDLAGSGMTLTLDEIELPRPSGSDQFHYTGECNPDYLCGKCQGDCEDDSACAEGLTCMVRSADEEVPGCSGTSGLWDGTSYCYDPAEATGRQGQEAQVDTTFQVGIPYTLKLEAPASNLFKGFMFRLEGDDGQDLSGAIETVSENMQVIASTGEMDDIEGETLPIMTTCASNVAAVCHTEAEEKSMVEALITFPEAGTVNLEATVMVGEHQWYMTNYVLQVEGSSTPSESPPTSTETLPSPTEGDSSGETQPPTEEETSGTQQHVFSLFVTVVLLGLGFVLF